jgi:hypothetical protein
MAEGSLNQVDRSAAVERMARMSVAKPVRRDSQLDAGASGGLADDTQDGHSFQRGAVFSGPEHGIDLAGFAAQLREGGSD